MNEKKTIIITGSNSGLGFECAKTIANNSDYQIILACRNMEKAEAAKDSIIKSSGNSYIKAMELDTSSLTSVRTFAKQYTDQASPLYGLICNAGINGMNTGITSDGFDIIFETNHLGHFLLANLLLPIFEPSGRIAVVSSDMHCPPGDELIWPGTSSLAHPDKQLAEKPLRYSYSKLCNLYFVYECSRRFLHSGSKITINALNPGLMIDTNFAPNKSRFTPDFLEKVSDRIGSLKESANALADIMVEPDFASTTGKYFDRGIKTTNSSPLSYHLEYALELWNQSISFAGLEKTELFL